MYQDYYSNYKIVNMDSTQNFFAMFSCTYNYKLIRSKSRILQIHFFPFFDVWIAGKILRRYWKHKKGRPQFGNTTTKGFFVIINSRILLIKKLTKKCRKLFLRSKTTFKSSCYCHVSYLRWNLKNLSGGFYLRRGSNIVGST